MLQKQYSSNISIQEHKGDLLCSEMLDLKHKQLRN